MPREIITLQVCTLHPVLCFVLADGLYLSLNASLTWTSENETQSTNYNPSMHCNDKRNRLDNVETRASLSPLPSSDQATYLNPEANTLFDYVPQSDPSSGASYASSTALIVKVHWKSMQVVLRHLHWIEAPLFPRLRCLLLVLLYLHLLPA